jgi:Fibronectin type III domain
MNKSFIKVFSLTIVLALMLMALPMQPAQAAGEPAAPSLLEAQASYPGDLAVTLFWSDNSLDETGFEIERCVGSGCTDFALYATRDSSIYGPWFNDVGLTEITTYSYRVRAVNAAGASEYSNVASATTSYARPDGQLTSLVGTFTNGAVELTWTENATNETRFEIERYEVGAGGTEFIVIGTVAPDTTSFVDTTALRGTSYDYRVVPWRFDIFGGAPIVVNVQTGTGIAAPTAVKANAISKSSVRLTWRGKFAAGTQVVVQRENCDPNGCFGWTEVGQVNASTGRFTDSGLSPATTYTYRIRAVSATSVSPFTDNVTATTQRR